MNFLLSIQWRECSENMKHQVMHYAHVEMQNTAVISLSMSPEKVCLSKSMEEWPREFLPTLSQKTSRSGQKNKAAGI
ncbi:hypothetical protein CKAN_00906200 [Cinnamomum micranthum f. kanehirae]|uniref:Uncharacterized protein n=1 Tax=Cinnamomum micranthum f. kanehirae TaxID=337451 RepID=A0A3S3Q6T9_9MAGN|nr:hypothetical protein CKAN_00906200 [Cinnamomum micranthum f. kanehirae]